MVAHVFILMGFIIAGVSTYYFSAQLLDPFWWMLLVGLGLYLVYIPFNSIFFDRLIAAFSMKGNAGFFIYVADSVGYVGSVSVMLVKEGMSLEIKCLRASGCNETPAAAFFEAQVPGKSEDFGSRASPVS